MCAVAQEGVSTALGTSGNVSMTILTPFSNSKFGVG
jgi:hypothetical protein